MSKSGMKDIANLPTDINVIDLMTVIKKNCGFFHNSFFIHYFVDILDTTPKFSSEQLEK